MLQQQQQQRSAGAISSSGTTTETQKNSVMRLSLRCPITHELFVDPVLAVDGFTYERDAIELWFRQSDKSPVTGVKISRALFPNHALRGALQDLYPDRPTKQRPVVESTTEDAATLPTTAEFPLSIEEIRDLPSKYFRNPPAMGSVYYGVFEQEFSKGESSARSCWTVRFEIDEVETFSDPVSVRGTFVWRKHEQIFSDDASMFEENFRSVLRSTVGKQFVCKVRGRFNADLGLLRMHTYQFDVVGNGFYELFVGDQGKALDGLFFLPSYIDPAVPSNQGMGRFRLRQKE